MRTFLAAATGLPTILLTAALVVATCFWLLAAVGVAAVGSFDTDVDLRAWHLSGVPVTVAFTVLTVLAWSLAVGATTVVAELAPPGPVTGLLLRPVVAGGAVLAAWATTRVLVRPLHRLFPDEPVPPASVRPASPAPPVPLVRPGLPVPSALPAPLVTSALPVPSGARAGDGAGLRDAGRTGPRAAGDPHRGGPRPRDAAPRPRSHAV